MAGLRFLSVNSPIRKYIIRYLTRLLYLPNRPSSIILKLFTRKEIIAVEVGVSRGDNSKDMLSRIPQISKIYLVDPYRYTENIEDQHRVDGDYNENKLIALDNLKTFKEKTVFIYEPYNSKFIPEKVDFIYIDGDHSTNSVISDIKESLKILRPKGMMAGHDIHYDSVKKGVESVFGKNYSSIGIDWWVKFK